MAGPIICDVCESEPAALLVTQLAGGDVMALCPPCAPDMLTRIAGAMSAPPDAAPSAQHGEGAGEADAVGDPSAEPAPASPNGKRRGRESAAVAAETDPAQPATAAQS